MPFLSIIVPFRRGYAWFKALMMLEASAYACCAVLPRAVMTKLISATAVSALFALISCTARPYIESVEGWADIFGRITVLFTLGVGIGLETAAGRAERVACNTILLVIVVAVNLIFLVALNPLKILGGVVAAVREMRAAARELRVASWSECTIKSFSADNVPSIIASDLASFSEEQKWWFLVHHGCDATAKKLGWSTELRVEAEGLTGALLPETKFPN